MDSPEVLSKFGRVTVDLCSPVEATGRGNGTTAVSSSDARAVDVKMTSPADDGDGTPPSAKGAASPPRSRSPVGRRLLSSFEAGQVFIA